MNTAAIYNAYDFPQTPLNHLSVRPLPQSVYRRRRLALLAIVGMIVFVSVLLANEIMGRIHGVPGGSIVEASGSSVVYVVQPGDSLWGIAEKFNPKDTDIRHTVDELVKIVGSSQLQPGQRLVFNKGL